MIGLSVVTILISNITFISLVTLWSTNSHVYFLLSEIKSKLKNLSLAKMSQRMWRKWKKQMPWKQLKASKTFFWRRSITWKSRSQNAKNYCGTQELPISLRGMKLISKIWIFFWNQPIQLQSWRKPCDCTNLNRFLRGSVRICALMSRGTLSKPTRILCLEKTCIRNCHPSC